jgi:RP/EB family microtubule-associated protein
MAATIQARNVYIAPTTPFNMSRVQLVQWVSDLSGNRYTKVEELCDGVAYCNIFQKMFPGKPYANQVIRT